MYKKLLVNFRQTTFLFLKITNIINNTHKGNAMYTIIWVLKNKNKTALLNFRQNNIIYIYHNNNIYDIV